MGRPGISCRTHNYDACRSCAPGRSCPACNANSRSLLGGGYQVPPTPPSHYRAVPYTVPPGPRPADQQPSFTQQYLSQPAYPSEVIPSSFPQTSSRTIQSYSSPADVNIQTPYGDVGPRITRNEDIPRSQRTIQQEAENIADTENYFKSAKEILGAGYYM